jgi:hypothetical protein
LHAICNRVFFIGSEHNVFVLRMMIRSIDSSIDSSLGANEHDAAAGAPAVRT